MADLYLADTSIWIPLARRRGAELLRAHLDGLRAADRLATCDMVRLEFLAGSSNEVDFRRNDQLLRGARRLATRVSEWNRAIQLGLTLRRRGAVVGGGDLVVAAVALANDAIVLHADSDYERIAQHSPLRTEPVFHLLSA